MIARLIGAVLLLLPLQVSAADDALKPCKPMLAVAGEPAYKSEPDDVELLCRDGYVLSHNNEHKTPDWVIEDLRPKRFTGPASRKALGDPFKSDPDLDAAKRAQLADYKKADSSGKKYDRGHMAPAADMTYSVEAMKESFYLSNMAPQTGIGLNRHIWADLEGLVRHWTCDRGHLLSITGPIYDSESPKTIGDGVAVPDAFYKIILDPAAPRVLAFILPNRKIDTKGELPEHALRPFIVSVREAEARTGINFFTAFDKKKQDRLELHKSAMWRLDSGCAKPTEDDR